MRINDKIICNLYLICYGYFANGWLVFFSGKQIDVATRIHKRYRSQTVEMSAFFHRLVQQSKKLSLSKDKEFINESGKAYLLQ